MEAQEQGSRSLLHIQCLDHCLGTQSTLGSYLASLGGGGDGFRILIFQIDLEFAKKTSGLSTNHGIEHERLLIFRLTIELHHLLSLPDGVLADTSVCAKVSLV